MKRGLRILLAVLLSSVAVAGCSKDNAKPVNGGTAGNVQQSAGESTLDKAKKQGFITVGFANEKPYAYATPDGKLTGEAVEVARTIITKLGIKEMNGVLTEFGSLIPGLKAERFDIITAGMFVTPERGKEVLFANPEYSIGEAIAVQKGNPKGIHSYKDIASKQDVKVAVMVGAIEEQYLTKSGVAKNQIVTVPDQPSAISALQSDRVQVVTMTGPSLQAMLDSAKDDKLERVKDFEQPTVDGKSVRGYGAAAFRMGDDDFVKAYNEELEKLKSSGELLTILIPFGFTEEELPGKMTATELTK
ncbi:ectoine/hydroxyectoine ABC transporter substrate-binding protein EhuB [Paenibacillus sp. NPDC056579]|uniref:ectoine/hydroxyectoine ABC transporter substrate-binding protein EhuB n=1 Tax=Paenibacillus sp. NPDC056579 TaxID=3345871 RepID=UPI0036A57234